MKELLSMGQVLGGKHCAISGQLSREGCPLKARSNVLGCAFKAVPSIISLKDPQTLLALTQSFVFCRLHRRW